MYEGNRRKDEHEGAGERLQMSDKLERQPALRRRAKTSRGSGSQVI